MWRLECLAENTKGGGVSVVTRPASFRLDSKEPPGLGEPEQNE